MATSDYCLHNQSRFHNTITKFYNSKITRFNKMWFIKPGIKQKEYERLIQATNFIAKFEMVFVLAQENHWQNVKTNRMKCTKYTYYKERSFATIYLIFLKIEIEYNNLLTSVDLVYQLPKSLNLSEGVFYLSILN